MCLFQKKSGGHFRMFGLVNQGNGEPSPSSLWNKMFFMFYYTGKFPIPQIELKRLDWILAVYTIILYKSNIKIITILIFL